MDTVLEVGGDASMRISEMYQVLWSSSPFHDIPNNFDLLPSATAFFLFSTYQITLTYITCCCRILIFLLPTLFSLKVLEVVRKLQKSQEGVFDNLFSVDLATVFD
ncbi:hypothetical protein SLA2020_482540 [Shorea laevis]